MLDFSPAPMLGVLLANAPGGSCTPERRVSIWFYRRGSGSDGSSEYFVTGWSFMIVSRGHSVDLTVRTWHHQTSLKWEAVSGLTSHLTLVWRRSSEISWFHSTTAACSSLLQSTWFLPLLDQISSVGPMRAKMWCNALKNESMSSEETLRWTAHEHHCKTHEEAAIFFHWGVITSS